jgi:hypothetical protein
MGDVILVGVRREEVRRVHLEPIDRREERLDGRSRIDEDRRAAGVIRDEIGVREPLRIHAPFDDHRGG